MNKAPLLFVALALLGCSSGPAYTYMANPFNAGKLPQNRILRPDTALEKSAGLAPGTLIDEAAMVALDDKRVCFELVLRVDAAHANLANPQGWRVSLSGFPFFNDDAPSFGDSAERKEEVQKGEATTLNVSTAKLCNDDTLDCRTKTQVNTGTKTVNVNVSTGGGMVCFANRGTITKATDHLNLDLDDPSGVGHRVSFVWQFVQGPALPVTPASPAAPAASAEASAPPSTP